jgi:hypothetical protein
MIFDLPGCSWKTPQQSEPEDVTSSSQTLWRADIPGATESCPRLLSAPLTGAIDGGCSPVWPTPTASQPVQVRGMGAAARAPSRGTTLAGAVKLYPTVIASDWKLHSPAKQASNSRPLREVIGATDGGPLNPAWCEWLMGWPIGHTASAPSATAKSRSVRRSRGDFSEDHR